MNQVILLEDGWNRLKSGGVMKIEQILEDVQGGDYKSGITTEEYSTLYTTVYTMCTQKPPNNWSEVTQPLHGHRNRLAVRCDLRTNLRTHSPPLWIPLAQHLYNNYCDAVKDYLLARILPRIKEKHDEAMLRELVRRWENHKLMIKFLSHVFKYLDRFYVKRL